MDIETWVIISPSMEHAMTEICMNIKQLGASQIRDFEITKRIMASFRED